MNFKHGEFTYTLRQPNLFDTGAFNALMLDISDVILKARGYEQGYKSDNIPRLLDHMIYRFVSLLQVTTIEGAQCPYDVNLYTFTVADVGAFDAWYEQITLNNELAEKWFKAFDEVTRKNADPLAPAPPEAD